MDKYMVIWANSLEEFDDYDEAIENAKTKTFEEKYCTTAMVIPINNLGNSKIPIVVTWIPDDSTWTIKLIGA